MARRRLLGEAYWAGVFALPSEEREVVRPPMAEGEPLEHLLGLAFLTAALPGQVALLRLA